jgi:prolyl oligopeptidase
MPKENRFLRSQHFSKDGTTSLGGLDFSKDGSKVAYAISEGGSDWRKVIIMDAITNKIIEDTIVDVKFSGVSWKANEGSTIPVMTNQKEANYRQNRPT